MNQAEREAMQAVQWSLGQALDELAWALTRAPEAPGTEETVARLDKCADVLDEVKTEVERRLGVPLFVPEGES
ncbi:hypothetical protein C8K30_110113 [Promicromonospora sp. AC04]|uniref:hypothetical protein n=1 Tax=Promicromonospora sp. AC04 TaxID=2135723 RepID=UPI000D4F4344|nr:hypothetical protein [Promicromonospora sp. AC04]PUB23970.1 hypothetical protein C8K30_110113 [Promicromonospora sp. AC04]